MVTTGAVRPPGPAQTSEYAVAAVNGPVLWLPLAASVPLQPPDAVHESALVDVHVKVEAPPEATAVGVAVKSNGWQMVHRDRAQSPSYWCRPVPCTSKKKSRLPSTHPCFCVPLLASVPLQSPEAAHEVA